MKRRFDDTILYAIVAALLVIGGTVIGAVGFIYVLSFIAAGIEKLGG